MKIKVVMLDVCTAAHPRHSPLAAVPRKPRQPRDASSIAAATLLAARRSWMMQRCP